MHGLVLHASPTHSTYVPEALLKILALPSGHLPDRKTPPKRSDKVWDGFEPFMVTSYLDFKLIDSRPIFGFGRAQGKERCFKRASPLQGKLEGRDVSLSDTRDKTVLFDPF